MSLSEQKTNPAADQLVKNLKDSLTWEGVSESTHNAIEETLLFLVAMYDESWHEHGSTLLKQAKAEVSTHLKREETLAEYWERVLHQNPNDNQPQE